GRKTRKVTTVSASGIVHGPRKRALSARGRKPGVLSSGKVDGSAASSALLMPGITSLSACGSVLSALTQTSAREGLFPSRAPLKPRIRYGRRTVAPSPVAEMLKVPAVLFGAYEER